MVTSNESKNSLDARSNYILGEFRNLGKIGTIGGFAVAIVGEIISSDTIAGVGLVIGGASSTTYVVARALDKFASLSHPIQE